MASRMEEKERRRQERIDAERSRALRPGVRHRGGFGFPDDDLDNFMEGNMRWMGRFMAKWGIWIILLNLVLLAAAVAVIVVVVKALT